MNRDYDREVTVYVWRFKNLSHFGHAAVKITGVRTLRNDDERAYISWWPNGSAGVLNAGFAQGASTHTSYKDDMVCETSDRAQRMLQGRRWEMLDNQRMVSDDPRLYGTVADSVVKLPALGA